MKSILIILVSFFISGCNVDDNQSYVNTNKKVTKTEPAKMSIDTNLMYPSIENNFIYVNSKDKPKKRSVKEKRFIYDVSSIYDWEYMYLFLMNTYIYKMDENHHAFANLVRKLKEQKINDIKVLEDIFKKKNLTFNQAKISLDGTCNFKSEKVNKVFKIFNEAKTKKEMYKNLCIGFNSIVYKYSILKDRENDTLNKYLFKIMENQNIKQLLLIDNTLKNIGINGCCEVSGVLCPKKKAQ